MKLEDLDFALQHEHGTIRLSELTDDDMVQIKKVTAAIVEAKIFKDHYKAILAAFHLYVESVIETNQWSAEGNPHH